MRLRCLCSRRNWNLCLDDDDDDDQQNWKNECICAWVYAANVVRTDNLLFGKLQYLFTSARSLLLLSHRRAVYHVVGRCDGRRPFGRCPPPSRPRPRQGALEPNPLDAGSQVPGDQSSETRRRVGVCTSQAATWDWDRAELHAAAITARVISKQVFFTVKPGSRRSPACCRTAGSTVPRDGGTRRGVDEPRPYGVGRGPGSRRRRLRRRCRCRRHRRRRRRRQPATQRAVPSGPSPAARRWLSARWPTTTPLTMSGRYITSVAGRRRCTSDGQRYDQKLVVAEWSCHSRLPQ